jgi:hypothetical protein
MRRPDEPQLEQDDGHEQDGDTGDIAPALYQQLGLRGLARRELCRHPGHLPHSPVRHLRDGGSVRGSTARQKGVTP